MSAAGTPSTDPWVIVAKERARYEDQFRSLKPNNGVITGDQAKGFFLQSQLPPAVLGQIWGLADTDSDGKMDINEFSIACKLINLKLRGFEIPKGLPPSLLASLKLHSAAATPPAIPPLPNPALVAASPVRPEPPKVIPIQKPIYHPPTQPLIGTAQPMINNQPIIPPTGIVQPVTAVIPTGIVPPMPTAAPPLVQPMIYAVPLPAAPTPVLSAPISPAGSVGAPIVGPVATSTPRASVTSLERNASIDSGSTVEWSVPHQTKLKYTQMFNTMDRSRSGFLSGAQARNVMVQTKLPQPVLAQIWALSDMDSDGRLGCEEFVLAMHLCESAQAGTPPPNKLPPDLVPPLFRRTARTASISSQGSAVPLDQDPASTLLQNKRKENYEKGQAELERRRKTLMDQQRKEAEERERKEREELERREKARQEAERKRLEELEKLRRDQEEKERQMEEERKRQSEQREAARKEMERQRQLEWEKQRLQELQQQRHREQEIVLKLKAKNQSLTIDLSSLNDQVRELSQKICDTRIGVSNVKTTIDGMRSTRDTQMSEMSQLKNKLKEQNARLLTLSQEKIKLDAKNKMNSQDVEQAKLAFENKDINIKNLRQRVADIELQIDAKMADIDNNNTQLSDLKTQMKSLINECEKLYAKYEEKRTQVLEIRSNRSMDYGDAWGGSNTGATTEWPVENSWNDNTIPEDIENIPGVHKYRAIYEFSARNNDEITFQPGDIIHVPEQQTGEPGWLAGEIGGHTGWFPESYVEPVDGVGIAGATIQPAAEISPIETAPIEPVQQESFAEITPPQQPTTDPLESAEPEYYIANYPYQSQEPGDLTFNAGDLIAVYKKDGEWWTGKLNNATGIFPSNYVAKTESAQEIVPVQGVSAAAVTSALETINSQQIDNEVSQLTGGGGGGGDTTAPGTEKPFDMSVTSNAQVMKGKKPEIASVIAPYQATSPEQLSLARGQLIMIRKKTDSGWWEGELQAKGRKRQVGWFPASYVKILNSTGKVSGRTTPVSLSRMQQEIVIDKVVALFPYTASNPDELNFLKDDIINVTAREEEAWWRGELNGVSGLFPSNYVTPLQQHQSDKKRLDAINELIQTEHAYVQDMSVVHQVFELPLRQSRIIPSKDIDEIFVNWQDILRCNENFLHSLSNAFRNNSATIGDVICQHLPLMTAYITFCGKQLDSAALLQNLTETNVSFRELVRKCQNNGATKGMPLSSFLIKPMQRITKYPLLIEKILESTPQNHADAKLLEEALRISEKFVSCVNENVRQKENLERMEWLQQSIQNDLNLTFDSLTNKLGQRQLIHFTTLTKMKTGKDLIGFLFNDFFMLVQPSKLLVGQFQFQKNTNIAYKLYKQPILVQYLLANRESSETVEHGTDSNRVLKIQDEKSGYKIHLLTSTVHECNTWMKRIESTKQIYQRIVQLSTKNSKRKTRKSHSESIYCKVALGTNEQQTDFARDQSTSFNNGNLPPNGITQPPTFVWNSSMQFQLGNINDEILTFVVLEYNPFSTDEFLGRAELKIKDIFNETSNTNGPIIKKLILHQVESGELTVKLDLHLFNNY